MVTVKEFKTRQNRDGEDFLVLVLQGGVTPVKSKETGRMYFTAKTFTVSTTFDEDTCKQLIGSQFPGEIVKVDTDPYEYTVEETGEVIELSHRWEYQDNLDESLTEPIVEEAEVY